MRPIARFTAMTPVKNVPTLSFGDKKSSSFTPALDPSFVGSAIKHLVTVSPHLSAATQQLVQQQLRQWAYPYFWDFLWDQGVTLKVDRLSFGQTLPSIRLQIQARQLTLAFRWDSDVEQVRDVLAEGMIQLVLRGGLFTESVLPGLFNPPCLSVHPRLKEALGELSGNFFKQRIQRKMFLEEALRNRFLDRSFTPQSKEMRAVHQFVNVLLTTPQTLRP